MTTRGVLLKTYTIELKLAVDKRLCDILVCDICDKLWVYCSHSGNSHVLEGSDAIEYLLNQLEVM